MFSLYDGGVSADDMEGGKSSPVHNFPISSRGSLPSVAEVMPSLRKICLPVLTETPAWDNGHVDNEKD